MRNSIAVINGVRPGAGRLGRKSGEKGTAKVDLTKVTDHFASRTRAVHTIPYDRHLAEGAVVDLERVSPATLKAYQHLAATVAADFGSWHRHAAH